MAWTERTQPTANWSTRTKPSGQAEVDFLFSDGTDFLFSDTVDYVFKEESGTPSWTLRTNITN